MFDNYFYLSSTSQQFRDHFVDIAKELKTDLKLKNTSVVVDIGSNDGVALKPFLEMGYKNILGIEPAKNLAKFDMMTCLTKQHSAKDIKRNSILKEIYPHLMISITL